MLLGVRRSYAFQGGGVASGGLRELIPTVARTAVAVGVDGIFLEVRQSSMFGHYTTFAPYHRDELIAELVCPSSTQTKKSTAF